MYICWPKTTQEFIRETEDTYAGLKKDLIGRIR